MDRISFSQAATSVPVERHVSNASQALSRSMERLSSGLRINRAADDAAGKAVAEELTTQVRGLAQAGANAQDAIQLLQTADGGLSQTANILQRMRELVIQVNNDTYTQNDRSKAQAEIEKLKLALTDIARQTQFNGRPLLDGSMTGSRFAEPNGAYMISNPTVGFPGQQGPMIRNLQIDTSGAIEDLIFSITYQNPGINYSALPGVSMLITTSAGFSATVPAVNEFWVANGPMIDAGTMILPTPGWGIGLFWGMDQVSPTMDAGKTFQLYLDHTLGAVTVDRSIQMQVGSDAGQTMRIALRSVTASELRLEWLSINGATEAESHRMADRSLRAIDLAMNRVNEERTRIGAWQNRLEQTAQMTTNAGIEQTTSMSRIQDTDMAQESAALTRSQLLQNASISLLSQANTIPNMALKLLETGRQAERF